MVTKFYPKFVIRNDEFARRSNQYPHQLTKKLILILTESVGIKINPLLQTIIIRSKKV